MIYNLALIGDQYRRVVDASETCRIPLVKSHMGENARLGTCLLQEGELRPVDKKAFAGKSCEEGVVVDWSGDGGLGAVSDRRPRHG